MTTYRNPWHKPHNPAYGPELYTTDARPIEYRGFKIYQRIKGHVWDCVLNDECFAQHAGPNGAKEACDKFVLPR